MFNNETELLQAALRYEQGHCRRTQHILKVYALAKLLGEQENLSLEAQQILRAAAILHDIAIKYCKERYNGDASQERQKLEAPGLVRRFLLQANYSPALIPQITELVEKHHDYSSPRNQTLQILMEADLIINCYETCPDSKKIAEIEAVFETPFGKELLALYIQGAKN